MTANINRLLTKAIAAHRAGLRSEAVALYTVILKSQPEHADTNHNLGVLALEEGRLGEAVGYTSAQGLPGTPDRMTRVRAFLC